MLVTAAAAVAILAIALRSAVCDDIQVTNRPSMAPIAEYSPACEVLFILLLTEKELDLSIAARISAAS